MGRLVRPEEQFQSHVKLYKSKCGSDLVFILLVRSGIMNNDTFRRDNCSNVTADMYSCSDSTAFPNLDDVANVDLSISSDFDFF